MRISTGFGGARVSMGPVGWLFIGPLLFCFWLLAFEVQLLVWFCVIMYRGTVWAIRSSSRGIRQINARR